MSAYGVLRQEFADTMLEIGRRDPKLVVMVSDITHFKLQPFARACPGRYYNIGVCEQSILSMAAGMSKVGLFPVVHTITPFFVERGFEQIKDDFGYQKLGVNIVTVGSAFDYSQLGCTHHCYGDFALLKTIENMQIVYPAGIGEFNILFRQTYNNGYPTYFRLPGAIHEQIFQKREILFGKGILVRKGSDVTIVAIGTQLGTAIKAAHELKRKRISAEVIYIHTIKPLDERLILKSIKKTTRCLVIEEHGKYGGVFDDVLRITKDLPNARFSSINIGDGFIHHYGTYEQIAKQLGFSPENLVTTLQNELF